MDSDIWKHGVSDARHHKLDTSATLMVYVKMNYKLTSILGLNMQFKMQSNACIIFILMKCQQHFVFFYCIKPSRRSPTAFYLRNKSALAVNCWVINHGLEVSCKVHYITSTRGERGGSVVECRTPEREVRGSRPTAAMLCPWAHKQVIFDLYLPTTDPQTVIYYSAINALEPTYLDSNTQEMMKRQLYTLQILPTFHHCTEESLKYIWQ